MMGIKFGAGNDVRGQNRHDGRIGLNGVGGVNQRKYAYGAIPASGCYMPFNLHNGGSQRILRGTGSRGILVAIGRTHAFDPVTRTMCGNLEEVKRSEERRVGSGGEGRSAALR